MKSKRYSKIYLTQQFRKSKTKKNAELDKVELSYLAYETFSVYKVMGVVHFSTTLLGLSSVWYFRRLNIYFSFILFHIYSL